MSADFANATIQWGTAPETLTLLDLMKQLQGIADNSKDTDYAMYLQMAGEACERYIDNKLALQDVKEEYEREVIPVALRYWPAPALTSVTVDGEDVTADWTVYYQDGVPWATTTPGAWETGTSFEQVSIAYTAGYEPLPTEVGYAIVSTAITYTNAGGSTAGAIKKESVVGVGSIEYTTESDGATGIGLLSLGTMGTLDLYRRINA